MSAGYSPLAVLSLAAQQDKSKLASGDAWIMLLDLIWSGQHFRFARNVDPVSFDAGDGNGVQTYQPFNFELSVDEPGANQLPTILLRASNTGRILQGIIEQYAGVVGATANIYVYNTAHPAGEPDLAITTEVIRSTCTAELVTFSLSGPSPMRQLFPMFLYRAAFCMWVSNYQGRQCGYVPQPITATVAGSDTTLTIASIGSIAPAGTQLSCTVSGYTGAWAAANGPQTLSVVNANTATIAVNSSAFGAVAGTPVITLSNCDGTYSGPNGCITHANATRFGAFPGIGTNGIVLAAQT